MQVKKDFLGYGLGLRSPHYQDILKHLPSTIDWFEVVTENYCVPGGRPHYYLEKVREHYPIVMHGVSLSIGSVDPLDLNYLQQVKDLSDRYQPAWISDHLCWTGVDGFNMHDLLPLPYTEEALQHVVDRVKQVQDFLGQQILLENVSSYVTYTDSEMEEWEFISEIAKRADCLILLDVNNIYVSAFNHQFSAETYIDGIPLDRVQQFHIAGHTKNDDNIIDTHDHSIIPSVWELYAKALKRFGAVSTLIERDDHIPLLNEMIAEVEQARAIAEPILQEQAA